jgi:hypothetical protein
LQQTRLEFGLRRLQSVKCFQKIVRKIEVFRRLLQNRSEPADTAPVRLEKLRRGRDDRGLPARRPLICASTEDGNKRDRDTALGPVSVHGAAPALGGRAEDAPRARRAASKDVVKRTRYTRRGKVLSPASPPVFAAHALDHPRTGIGRARPDRERARRRRRCRPVRPVAPPS